MKFFSLLFATLLLLLSNANAAEPEYNRQCTMGMAEGHKLVTSCSVFWLGPNDKIYCFFNEEAKQRFLQKVLFPTFGLAKTPDTPPASRLFCSTQSTGVSGRARRSPK